MRGELSLARSCWPAHERRSSGRPSLPPPSTAGASSSAVWLTGTSPSLSTMRQSKLSAPNLWSATWKEISCSVRSAAWRCSSRRCEKRTSIGSSTQPLRPSISALRQNKPT